MLYQRPNVVYVSGYHGYVYNDNKYSLYLHLTLIYVHVH